MLRGVGEGERGYRDLVGGEGLEKFRVVVGESDLFISAERRLDAEARELLKECREEIEGYTKKSPAFKESLEPLPLDRSAPAIVREMMEASAKVGVGPMAAVAGAIAEYVGRGLLREVSEVIVENGGDVFIRSNCERRVLIFAGESPLSLRIGLKLQPTKMPVGVCTSAGRVGHSLSFGEADAVVVLSKSTALADAAATAIGNQIREAADFTKAIDVAKSVEGVKGIVLIKGDEIGAWGDLELIKG